jgi:hypothetical protein
MGLSNILFIFNGDHKWPNDSIILRAFDWIELENLKQNNPHSKDLLFKYYAKDYTIANNKETSSNLISAYYEYINIIKNYSDIINVDSITLKILEIENNRSFNKKLKNKKKYELYEQELTQKYFDMIAVGMYSQSDTIFEYWKIKAKKLQRQIKSKNIEESKMAERIQSKIWMWCYESGLEFKKNNEIDFFIFANKLWTLIRPDHIYPNFQLAKYYASTGDNKETLYFLKRCVNNGLIDKKVLISTKEFENLKNNKDFQKLLNL